MTKKKPYKIKIPDLPTNIRRLAPLNNFAWGNTFTAPPIDGVYLFESNIPQRRAVAALLLAIADAYPPERLILPALVDLVGDIGVKLLGAGQLIIDGDVSSGSAYSLTVDIDPSNPAHFTIHVVVKPTAAPDLTDFVIKHPTAFGTNHVHVSAGSGIDVIGSVDGFGIPGGGINDYGDIRLNGYSSYPPVASAAHENTLISVFNATRSVPDVIYACVNQGGTPDTWAWVPLTGSSGSGGGTDIDALFVKSVILHTPSLDYTANITTATDGSGLVATVTLPDIGSGTDVDPVLTLAPLADKCTQPTLVGNVLTLPTTYCAPANPPQPVTSTSKCDLCHDDISLFKDEVLTVTNGITALTSGFTIILQVAASIGLLAGEIVADTAATFVNALVAVGVSTINGNMTDASYVKAQDDMFCELPADGKWTAISWGAAASRIAADAGINTIAKSIFDHLFNLIDFTAANNAWSIYRANGNTDCTTDGCVETFAWSKLMDFRIASFSDILHTHGSTYVAGVGYQSGGGGYETLLTLGVNASGSDTVIQKIEFATTTAVPGTPPGTYGNRIKCPDIAFTLDDVLPMETGSGTTTADGLSLHPVGGVLLSFDALATETTDGGTPPHDTQMVTTVFINLYGSGTPPTYFAYG